MNYASIWAIDEIWTKLGYKLNDAESKALLVTGLIQSLREAFSSQTERIDDERENVRQRRFAALLDMAFREGNELLAAVLGSRELMEQRQEVFADILRASHPTHIVWEALDEAKWILEAAGVSPLILMFDQAEAERIGTQPLIDLEVALQRIMEFIDEANQTEDLELRAALQAALELVQRLAEGAKQRQWWRMPQCKGTQVEPRSAPAEAESMVDEAPVLTLEVEGKSDATRDTSANVPATGESTKVKGGSKGKRRRIPKAKHRNQ